MATGLPTGGGSGLGQPLLDPLIPGWGRSLTSRKLGSRGRAERHDCRYVAYAPGLEAIGG